jgi:putative chitinase
MITLDQLKLIMPKCPSEWGMALLKAMPEYLIHTPAREAAFLAQLAHESVELTRVVENLNYSAESLRRVFSKYFPNDAIAAEYARKPERIANKVYANRMGNGDEASGDGWKFRGKGPIQLTGKNNHRQCGLALGVDLIEYPELLLEPEIGSQSACWFWKKNGLNDLADQEDFITITRRINGGTIGLEERKKYWEAAKKILY